MKVLMPDEAKAKNIITKRELQAILLALKPYGRINATRAQIKAMDSVAPKIEQVLTGIKS